MLSAAYGFYRHSVTIIRMPITTVAIWGIVAATILAIIIQPFRMPEAVWAVCGAAVLCITGLLPWPTAIDAMGKGIDVYLFLSGMLLAAELARQEGVFDYLAALAAQGAKGSARRLFFLVYSVGTVITVLMSNDATAVVLTPAVLAVTRAVKAKHPLPYLYACAFIANAASFTLPISNPANLVVFQKQMPTLMDWMGRFTLPSIVSIVMTYLLLRVSQKSLLQQSISDTVKVPALSSTGKYTTWGIIAMATVMLTASAFNVALGWPTFLASVVIYVIVCMCKRQFLIRYLSDIAWGILPLVAGLFVLVAALEKTGVLASLAALLEEMTRASPTMAIWVAGLTVALSSNVANNLPVGLLAGTLVSSTHPADAIISAILIGVNLGPNLSITGSLATLLWLAALRREGIEVSAIAFLKLGVIVMLPTLIATVVVLQLSVHR
jgi:arsenical pump membrane protein